MSQRPPASGPSSSSPHEETRTLPTPNPTSFAPSSSGVGGGDVEAQYTEGSSLAGSARSGTPEQQQTPLSPRPRLPEPRPSRSLGVHNILNPPHVSTEGPLSQGLNRSQSVAQLRSPSRPLPLQPPELPHPGRWPLTESPTGRGASPAERSVLPPTQPPRRILTPKSPFRRATSLGRVSLPGTISAQQSPFLPVGPKSYPSDPNTSSEIPRIPTSPNIQRYPYPFPTASGPTPPSRRVSGGGGPSQQSQAVSPSTSYSSFSQPGQPSPTPQYGHGSSQPGPTSGMYALPPPSEMSASPIVFAPEGSYGPPVAGSSQSSFQLMTLDTDQGPIQVPVDVQAASKVADEKRKRNAGASARFRQRRKEKEREASSTIAKLEEQNRDLADEAAFYRRERDYFRDLVYNNPTQAARVAPRPVSPRGRREIPQRATVLSYQDQEMVVGMERNTRRRTDDYPASFSLPPPNAAPPPLPPQYGPPAVPHPRQPQEHHLAAGSTTLPPPPSATRPESYPPPRGEPYGRSWPSGR